MALGRCESCNTALRFGSRTCARCGTQKKRLKYVFIAVIAVECAVIVQHLAFPKTEMAYVETSHAAQPELADTAAPAGWLYFQTVDDMIYDTTHHARVLSRSDQTAAEPQAHGSAGVLELRASPAYGRSVVITLKRAASDTVAGLCQLRAKFDSGSVTVFDASGSADSANATLVISDASGFTERLVSARTLVLDAVLSSKTERVASFDVAGLKWQ